MDVVVVRHGERRRFTGDGVQQRLQPAAVTDHRRVEEDEHRPVGDSDARLASANRSLATRLAHEFPLFDALHVQPALFDDVVEGRAVVDDDDLVYQAHLGVGQEAAQRHLQVVELVVEEIDDDADDDAGDAVAFLATQFRARVAHAPNAGVERPGDSDQLLRVDRVPLVDLARLRQRRRHCPVGGDGAARPAGQRIAAPVEVHVHEHDEYRQQDHVDDNVGPSHVRSFARSLAVSMQSVTNASTHRLTLQWRIPARCRFRRRSLDVSRSEFPQFHRISAPNDT